ncbi:MAG: hypothetical protein JWN01_863 [Patescibacteria group bacterium]|nr:hypothetical protein [Patescibacteria group bacterium]
MKGDTAKTLVGLVIIGLIVVATFIYGNAQRQAQLRHDQDVKKQQDAKVTQSTKKSPSVQPRVSSTPPKQQANGTATAPVQTPASNTLQGNGQTPAPTSTPVTGGTGGQVAGAQTANGTGLPETGSPLTGLIGVTAIVAMLVALRRSKRAVFAAARGRR